MNGDTKKSLNKCSKSSLKVFDDLKIKALGGFLEIVYCIRFMSVIFNGFIMEAIFLFVRIVIWLWGMLWLLSGFIHLIIYKFEWDKI